MSKYEGGYPLTEAALKAGAAALRASLSREDREQALREYGKAIHLRHMGEAGATALLRDADKCRAAARRLLQLDPTPTEGK